MSAGLQRAVDATDDGLMNLRRTRYLDQLEGRSPASVTRKLDATFFTATVRKVLRGLV